MINNPLVNQHSADTEQMDPFDIISKFRSEKAQLYNQAFAKTSDMNVLAKMYDYPILTRKLLFRCSYLTVDIYDILRTYKDLQSTNNNIMIHLPDLGVYALFDYRKYEMFISSIADAICDESIEQFDVNLYQIVLTEQRQKLVFSCTDAEYLNNMQLYIKGCFDIESNVVGNQVTVHMYCYNGQALYDNYNRLRNYIIALRDVKCSESMQITNMYQTGNDTYRSFKCSDFPGYDADISMNYLYTDPKTSESLNIPKALTHFPNIADIKRAINNHIRTNYKQGYVYLITEQPFSNIVKIGSSVDPAKRVSQLQTGNPNKLVVTHTAKYIDYESIETLLHDICKDFRVHGEWFRVTTTELNVLIASICNDQKICTNDTAIKLLKRDEHPTLITPKDKIVTVMDDRRQIARDWVINNKPLPNERTTTYYDRYKIATHKPVSPNELGPIVSDILKRKSVRGTDGRHW